MKEDTMKSDTSAAGKYRISSPRVKNGKTSNFAEGAVNSLDNSTGTSYQSSGNGLGDSASQILSMAGDNAKKAYGFINKYKYQTLGIIGVAGLAGAGYMMMSKRKSRGSALPASKSMKRAGKTSKTAKSARR